MEILTHANSPLPLLQNTTDIQQPLLLAQGTYGCVYYPGFTCKGKQQKTKYITKIQQNGETLENELAIGEIIQKIKHYKNYFAPILSQCPVNLSTIQKNYPQSLNQCKVVTEHKNQKPNNKQQQQAKFNLNKIRYILGDDLEETFHQKKLSSTTQQETPLPFLLDTYQYLSKSLKKLKKQNILHYDLKANNIIYDKESEIPIIIDFGLSINLNQINPQAPDPQLLTHYFFDTYQYDYWCLEPIWIGMYASFYSNQPASDQQLQQPISPILLTMLKESISQYIQYSFLFKPEFLTKLSQLFPQPQPQPQQPQLLIQTSIQTFTKTFHDKWQKTLEEHSQDTNLQFFQYLWKSRFQWDSYSLSVIYLDFLSQLTPLPPDDPQLPKLETFTQSLLEKILSLP
jgi:serine/threonine protein kinase